MRDINYVKAMAQNCIEEMNAIGLYPQITADDFSINTRINRVLARTWRINGKYTIEMSARILSDETLESGIRLTILHELCHASDETFDDGHRGNWKKWAEFVNDCYNVDIQRLICTNQYNIPPRKTTPTKTYRWKCSACGNVYTTYHKRAPKWYMHPQKFEHTNCPCGKHKGRVLSEYYNFQLV